MNSGPKLKSPPPTPQNTPDLDESIRRKRRKLATRGRDTLKIGLSLPLKSNSAMALQIPKGDSNA